MFQGNIFVCADLHGDGRRVRDIAKQIPSATDKDVIIVAGDAGFEYEQVLNDGTKKKAERVFPGYWVVMRGNHDSSYWARHTRMVKGIYVPDDNWSFVTIDNSTYLRQDKFPNILYVNDIGGIYKIGSYHILFCPGAYSIDKEYRLTRGWPYNKNEQIDYKTQLDLLDLIQEWNEHNNPIDFVIGHTFPLKLEPQIQHLYLDFIDQSTVDKRTESWLDKMSEIYEKNPEFKAYIGGHYHSDITLSSQYHMVYNNVIKLNDFIGE